jgi:hypothetical protein
MELAAARVGAAGAFDRCGWVDFRRLSAAISQGRNRNDSLARGGNDPVGTGTWCDLNT